MALGLKCWQLFASNAAFVEYMYPADNKIHLGRNYYIETTRGSPFIDIRKYAIGGEDVDFAPVPVKEGIILTPEEFHIIVEALPRIEEVLPEMAGIIPCSQREDHQNLEGALNCLDCNPDYYLDCM